MSIEIKIFEFSHCHREDAIFVDEERNEYCVPLETIPFEVTEAYDKKGIRKFVVLIDREYGYGDFIVLSWFPMKNSDERNHVLVTENHEDIEKGQVVRVLVEAKHTYMVSHFGQYKSLPKSSVEGLSLKDRCPFEEGEEVYVDVDFEGTGFAYYVSTGNLYKSSYAQTGDVFVIQETDSQGNVRLENTTSNFAVHWTCLSRFHGADSKKYVRCVKPKPYGCSVLRKDFIYVVKNEFENHICVEHPNLRKDKYFCKWRFEEVNEPGRATCIQNKDNELAEGFTYTVEGHAIREPNGMYQVDGSLYDESSFLTVNFPC